MDSMVFIYLYFYTFHWSSKNLTPPWPLKREHHGTLFSVKPYLGPRILDRVSWQRMVIPVRELCLGWRNAGGPLKIKRSPLISYFCKVWFFFQLYKRAEQIFFLFLNSSFGWRWNRVHWHSKTDAEIDPKLHLVSTTGKKIYVTYLITGTYFPRGNHHIN